MHISLRVLALIGLPVLLAACGNAPTTLQGSNRNPLLKENLTGASNASGKEYTGFAPLARETMGLATPSPSEKNLTGERSRSIELKSVQLDGKPFDFKLSVLALYKGQSQLSFAIPLTQEYASNPKEFSPGDSASSPIRLKVQCLVESCSSVGLSFLENGVEQLTVKHTAERRKIRLQVPQQQEASAQTLLAQWTNGLDREVEIKATEIAGSNSQFELVSVPQGQLADFSVKGELLNTDGDCTPLKFESSVDLYADPQVCLMGNSQMGDLVFRMRGAFKELTEFFISTLPRQLGGGRLPKVLSPGGCLSESYEQPHSFLGPIESDCSNPVVQNYISEVWFNPRAAKQDLKGFVQLNAIRQLQGRNPRSTQLSEMLKVLRQNNMPELTALVSLIESSFRATAESPVGARGWWQIMPKTATQALGLKLVPIDERTLIDKSTAAASTYLKQVLEHPDYRNNLKIALASYNAGFGGILSRSGLLRRDLKSGRHPGYEKLSFEEITAYSRDFWVLHKYKILPPETQDYVPRIISAMVLAASPGRANYNKAGRFRLD